MAYAASADGIRVSISADLDNVGLVTVLEQDLITVSRVVGYELFIDQFMQAGPNTLPFREVARECTRLVGIQNYDAYQKRNDGSIPVFYDAFIGCMKNSNFHRARGALVAPIRMRVAIQDSQNASKSFYVRKLSGALGERRLERYRVADLLACLSGKQYELVALDALLPRPMFRIVERR